LLASAAAFADPPPSSAAPKIEVTLENGLGPSYVPARARGWVDGTLLFDETGEAALRGGPRHTIYQGELTPGVHAFSLHVTYEGKNPVFGYVNRYRFHMRARATVSMKPGRVLAVAMQTFEQGDVTLRWEARPEFKVVGTPKDAVLDLESMPLESREVKTGDGGVDVELDPSAQAELQAKSDAVVHEVLQQAEKRNASTQAVAAAESPKGAAKARPKPCVSPSVHYTFARFSLSTPARRALERLSSCLLRNERVRVRVSGHCDARGTPGYNQELGGWRADGVSRFLVGRGLPPARIETQSFGKDRPLCKDDSEECHARNRRAEIELVDESVVTSDGPD
jgi:peptidoglycan-associated lipoprotein